MEPPVDKRDPERGARRHDPVFPGFGEMAQRRRSLTGQLASRRQGLGLSQTEVASRMGTSQSAVARLETGGDARLSTLLRYADALGLDLSWRLDDQRPTRGRRR